MQDTNSEFEIRYVLPPNYEPIRQERERFERIEKELQDIEDRKLTRFLRKWIGIASASVFYAWVVYVAILLPFMPSLQFSDRAQVAIIGTVAVGTIVGRIAGSLFPSR